MLRNALQERLTHALVRDARGGRCERFTGVVDGWSRLCAAA